MVCQHGTYCLDIPVVVELHKNVEPAEQHSTDVSTTATPRFYHWLMCRILMYTAWHDLEL
jgi:hypothetical protein